MLTTLVLSYNGIGPTGATAMLTVLDLCGKPQQLVHNFQLALGALGGQSSAAQLQAQCLACAARRWAAHPLFEVMAPPGAGRCAPDPRPLSHPSDPPCAAPPSAVRRLERLLPNRDV